MNVAAEPLSRQLIRKITWKVREIAGCDDVLYFPIVHFIEWVLANPENDMKMEFEIVEPCEMKDTYGTTNTGNNIMQMNQIFPQRKIKYTEDNCKQRHKRYFDKL